MSPSSPGVFMFERFQTVLFTAMLFREIQKAKPKLQFDLPEISQPLICLTFQFVEIVRHFAELESLTGRLLPDHGSTGEDVRGGTLPGAHLAGECHPSRCGRAAARGPNREMEARHEMFQRLRLPGHGCGNCRYTNIVAMSTAERWPSTTTMPLSVV